jgi:hypothetical protein
MKKLLYIFLATSLMFTSCSEDDDATAAITNQFSGNWTGTYSGGDSGVWAATMALNGAVNGSSTNANGNNQTLSGSVTNSGSFSATVGTGTLGSEFIGTLSGNTGNGTWSNSAAGLTGTWEGVKQ